MKRTALAIVTGLIVSGAGSAVFAADNSAQLTLLQRGEYLAVAADCAACHTNTEHQPMAGGKAISSPLGAIIASNITPSKQYGIGNYSLQQFSDVLRKGVNAKGENLYPAMPYTSYHNLSDQDIAALYQYLMHDVQPVDSPVPATKLPFPFDIRLSMKLWNALFLSDTPFKDNPDASAQVNRGDYLISALTHCDTCHTPRNALMAERSSQALSGAYLGQWYAPNITSDKVSGIGDWSDEQLYQYLKTGHATGKAQAAGPMAEAVSYSFQYLSDNDLHAIIASLKQVTPIRTAASAIAPASKPVDDEARIRGLAVSSGMPLPAENNAAILYSGNCAACHTPSGIGSYNQYYPSLLHNTAVNSANPTNLIATILFGVQRTVGNKTITMPAFGPTGYPNTLSFQQVAAITNYVRQTYGHQGSEHPVTAADVEQLYHGGPKPAIALLASAWLWGGAVIILFLIIVLLVVTLKRGEKS